jgi:hypothetical protein
MEDRIRFEFSFGNFEERKGTGALSRPYWVYHITVRTNFKRYAQEQFQTVHRYSDFEWLRNRLSEAFPFVIIPPLPPKDLASSLPGTSPSSELLEFRQRALRKFLSRVGAHPQLQRSEVFQIFLEKPEAEFHAIQSAPYEQLTLPRLLAKIDDPADYQQASEGKSAENLAVDARAWIECETYFDSLKKSFWALRSQQDQLSHRRRMSGDAIDLFGAAFQKIGDIESKTAEGERQETPLSTAVVATGKHAADMGALYREQAERESKQVAETMVYYAGMCESAKETLKRITDFNKKLEALAKDVEDKRVSLEKLKAKMDPKMAGAEAELRDKTVALGDMRRAISKLEALFREEVRQFHRDKQYDMKSMLKAFIDLQHDYAERMKKGWEGLSPVIDAAKVQ